MVSHKIIFCLVLLCLLQGCSSSHQNKRASAGPDSFYTHLMEFYRGPLNHMSAVRKGECPMYPSCSQYSIEAVRKHGWMKGWMMTHDRLLRCGRDEMKLATRIRVDGKLKYFDPVENNDFWWASTPQKDDF